MLIKRRDKNSHPTNLTQCFEIMKTFNLWLNFKKYIFVVQTEFFFLDLWWQAEGSSGLESSPILKKVNDILDMQALRKVKDVYQLMSWLTVLSRFLSWPMKKYMTFFQTLNKINSLWWTLEYQQAFEYLKSCLTSTLVLLKLEKKEALFVYLAASNWAIITILIQYDGQGA